MKTKTGMIIKQLLGNSISIELPAMDIQIKVIKLAFIVQIIMSF